MVNRFIDKLERSMMRNNSLLCVGLDPDIARIPTTFMPNNTDVERLKGYCLHIIEQTASDVSCYKPNIAFFEQFGGEGLDALKEIIARIPPDLPVLLDAKRGDIGNTAKAYARAAFEVLNVDAITVNPYLGADSVTPFLGYEGKMVFLLCYTSNPSAAEIQHHGAYPLFRHIAKVAQTWGNAAEIGFVVGATQLQALSAVRHIAPDRWILAPGVGAQGGNLDDALAAGLNDQGSGLIIPVSRAIMYAEDPRSAAKQLRAQINERRANLTSVGSMTSVDEIDRTSLVRELFAAGCIRFGEFRLASGKTSPIYIDLRRIISYPALFSQVVDAYAQCVSDLKFDRLAAVPYAALPLTGALGVHLRVPIIYPRKEVKAYGTGQNIEGVFDAGQVAVPIEDVITTGGSLLTAIQTLEDAQLIIRDIVVLVDREQGGRERLRATGYELHAILTLKYMLETLKTVGCIDSATYERVMASGKQ